MGCNNCNNGCGSWIIILIIILILFCFVVLTNTPYS